MTPCIYCSAPCEGLPVCLNCLPKQAMEAEAHVAKLRAGDMHEFALNRVEKEIQESARRRQLRRLSN